MALFFIRISLQLVENLIFWESLMDFGVSGFSFLGYILATMCAFLFLTISW